MHTIATRAKPKDATHRARIIGELKDVGVSRLGLNRFDIHYLPTIIGPTEHIMGVVHGYNQGESVILVATDSRIIFLNKKPFFVNQDDISYDIIGGVSFGHAGFGTTVTLHTRIKDFTVHTLNRRSAGRFVHFVEFHCMRISQTTNRSLY